MFKQFFLSDKNIMVAILLNAIVIFLMYFPELEGNVLLESLDHFFILIFVIEAIVKIHTFKPRGYFGSGWNLFDFIIIMASVPALFLVAFRMNSLLILRLFRLVRLIRFVRFVPHFAMILSGLGRAFRASLFVLLVLVFLNFMLAVFTCHFFGEIAPDYFGNPLTSSYSIFQMFTVEGWNEIPAAIIAGENGPKTGILIGLTRFYFVLIVLFGGIFGMSLANAIFVDEMTMDNTRELENKIDDLTGEIAEIKNLLKSRQ